MQLQKNKRNEIQCYRLGVNCQDQFLSSFPVTRRYSKGYKTCFLCSTQHNSFMERKTNCRKREFSKFQLNFVDQVLECVIISQYPTHGRRTSISIPLTISGSTVDTFCNKDSTNIFKRKFEKCEVAHIPIHLFNYNSKLNLTDCNESL